MKTRNIIAILAALPIAAAFTACSSDEVTEAKPAKEMLIVEGSIKGSVIEFRASEPGIEVPVSADCHWKVTYSNTWTDSNGLEHTWTNLTVQPSEGRGNGTLIIKTDENASLENRMATVTLTSDGGLKQVITIRQTSSDPGMNLSTTSFSYEPIPTAAQQLTITSNSTWTIEMPSGIDWLTLDKMSGGVGATAINVFASEIQTDEDRTAKFSILYGGKSQEVQVTQTGKTSISLSVSSNELDYFAPNGGSRTVSVTCNGAWRVYVPSSVSQWLHVEPASGVGNGEFSVFCEPYNDTARDRMSLVIVTAGSKNPQQEDILIQQLSALYPSLHELHLINSSSHDATLAFEFDTETDVEEYGLCYSATNNTPTVNDEHIVIGSGHPTDIEGVINDLSPHTTYYVRGYVKTSVVPKVTLYTNMVSFTTQSESGAPNIDDNINPQLSPRH